MIAISFATGHLENSICEIPVCRYVATMNWQMILPLLIFLGVAAMIWRSSGTKKHNHGCGCGCAHEDDAGTRKDKAGS